MGAEADFDGVIDLIEMKAWTFTGERDDAPRGGRDPGDDMATRPSEWRDKLIESLGEVDEQTMISYIEGHKLTSHEIHAALRRAASRPNLATLPSTPVFCGSALKNKGVQLLLDAVVEFLPSPDDVPPISGIDPKTRAKSRPRAEGRRAVLRRSRSRSSPTRTWDGWRTSASTPAR